MKRFRGLLATALVTAGVMTGALLPVALATEPYSAAHLVRVLPSEARGRPVEVHFWYPTAETQPEERFGQSKLFNAVEVIPDARAVPGDFPVVLLAQGGMRSAFIHTGWIASALARRGFIVVVPKPPGGRELQAADAANELLLRPADLSLAMTALNSIEPLSSRADMTDVSGVGFFLGGTSMLSLAGAGFDPEGYRQSCNAQGINIDCSWLNSQGVDLATLPDDFFARNISDARLTNLVVINPELTSVLKPRSVESIQVPVKLISLSKDAESPLAPAEQLKSIPAYSAVNIASASPFSAFSECTEIGKKILQAEGEGELCNEPGGRSRAEIHQQLIDEIVEAISAGRR